METVTPGMLVSFELTECSAAVNVTISWKQKENTAILTHRGVNEIESWDRELIEPWILWEQQLRLARSEISVREQIKTELFVCRFRLLLNPRIESHRWVIVTASDSIPKTIQSCGYQIYVPARAGERLRSTT